MIGYCARWAGLALMSLGCAGSGTSGTTPRTTPAPRTAAPSAPGAAAPAAAEHGKAVMLAPPPFARYVLRRSDSVGVQLPDSSTRTQVFERDAWLDTRASNETGGFKLVITLDSIAVTGPMLPPQAALDSARGVRWTAHLSTEGKLSSVEADRPSSIASQFAAMFPYLYPSLPDPDIRAGAAWTDSATTPTRADNFDVTERAQLHYVVTGPVVHGNGTVLVISGTGTFARTGTATQFGQPMQLESGGNRTVTHYLSMDGVPAGLEGSETSKATITVPAVGQSLNVTQASHFTVGIEATP